jgi:hypothetical protein
MAELFDTDSLFESIAELPVETPKPAPDITSSGTNSDLPLIFGISVVILFVVVLIVIMKRRKRNSVASLDQPYEHSGIPLQSLRQTRHPSSVHPAAVEPLSESLPCYVITSDPAIVAILPPYSGCGNYRVS